MKAADINLFDGIEFSRFCTHFNSRICAIDVFYKFSELKNPSYDPNAVAQLYLPIYHERAARHLTADSHYASFLQRVCRKFSLIPEVMDSFRSEFDDASIDVISEALCLQSQRVQAKNHPEQSAVLIDAPDFVSDILLAPISQLHTEIVENCNHFALYIERLETVGGSSKQLFLNARSHSLFSHYILTWVANRMGVPLRAGDTDTKVLVI